LWKKKNCQSFHLKVNNEMIGKYGNEYFDKNESERFLFLWKYFLSMLILRHIFFCLVYQNVPSSATWAVNATTVAGKANGTSGSSNSSLYYPFGITIPTDGILYIADSMNCRIVMVNIITSTVSGIFGSIGSASNQFDLPIDVFITGTSLYVLDNGNIRIEKWSSNGTNPSIVIGTASIAYGSCMFIDGYGSIYVSDSTNDTVKRVTSNSSSFVTIAGNGTFGNSANQLTGPNGIYVDNNLTLYIADTGNSRIQMWKHGATSGYTVAGTGTAGSSLAQLSYPQALIVDINGYMYIADTNNNRILRWAPNATSGVCIAGCAGTTSGTRANQFYHPVDLAFDNNGSLYISDHFNNRIQKFQILNNQSNIITCS
jgi:sugar lactone lactonase YvrE